MAERLQYRASLKRVHIAESRSELHAALDRETPVEGQISINFKLDQEDEQVGTDSFIVRASVTVEGKREEDSLKLFEVSCVAVGYFGLEKGDYKSLSELQESMKEDTLHAPAFQLGSAIYPHVRAMLEGRFEEFGFRGGEGGVLPASIASTPVLVEENR